MTSTAIHPDSDDLIPWVFRLSSFVPVNLPLEFGMIIAAPTPFNTIFWQLINQTYNACFNYYNRNATSTYSYNDIFKSYGIACFSSISVSLGIRRLLKARTAAATGGSYYLMNAFSSFVACGSADFLNVWCMRNTEIKKGIDVINPETN